MPWFFISSPSKPKFFFNDIERIDHIRGLVLEAEIAALEQARRFLLTFIFSAGGGLVSFCPDLHNDVMSALVV